MSQNLLGGEMLVTHKSKILRVQSTYIQVGGRSPSTEYGKGFLFSYSNWPSFASPSASRAASLPRYCHCTGVRFTDIEGKVKRFLLSASLHVDLGL